MRIYNRYLLSLVFASCLIDVILAFIKQTDITAYFTITVIAYLVITLLFIYLNPKIRKTLSMISVVFLAGFAVVVVLKVVEALSNK